MRGRKNRQVNVKYQIVDIKSQNGVYSLDRNMDILLFISLVTCACNGWLKLERKVHIEFRYAVLKKKVLSLIKVFSVAIAT